MTTLTSNAADIRMLRAFLQGLGYSDKNIRTRFPVWLGRTIETVDLAGFGKKMPKDMTTATIVGRSLSSRDAMEATFEAARAIACPAAVFAFPDSLELWSVAAAPENPRRIQAVPRQEVGRLARELRDDLQPAALLEAKTYGRQLSLFPVDVRLLASARQGSSEQLSDLVARAMKKVLTPLPAGEQQRRRALNEASRVVVGTLAALMIRDKSELKTSGSEVFSVAATNFPGYFDWLEDLGSFGEEKLNDLLDILDSNISYEGLDPTIVSHVYEEAVVSQSDRLRLGIYYTPPDLARQVAEHVPFEEIAPEDRLVLDPACGSGTLLLAAHDRLQSLTPARLDPFERHDYLVSHLLGYDADQFAVEVAKLSLLMNALPIGNSWHIEQRDTLRADPPTLRPSVVMCNPPWRDIRSQMGQRRQVADQFLEWMLAAVKPGGFIAAILPAAWLSSDTSKEARRSIQERADLFEVWRLPEGTFGRARLAPCVVLAQAKPASGRPWVFRRVRSRRGLDRFYETGAAGEQLLTSRVHGIRQDTLLRGPLDEVATSLAALPRLGTVTTVRSGPVPKPPAKSIGGSGEFLYLPGASAYPAFGEAPRAKLIPVRFPEDFHRAGRHNGGIYRRAKVLVPASRDAASPWRLKVGIDRLGVIPRSTLHMVIPSEEDEDQLFALFALLGSAVASCWIDSYDPKRDIDTALLRDLPVPPRATWPALARIGRDLAAANPFRKALLARRLDEEVARAYELPDSVSRRIRQHFGGYTAPEGGARYEARGGVEIPTGVETRRFGAVFDVKGEQLRIWVPGVTEDNGALLPLPRRFLGWHCVPDSTFEVASIGDDLHAARYFFQARSYQRMNELPEAAEAH